MAFFQKLFGKTDPLEQKAKDLVAFSRITATGMYIPVIEQFKFLEHCKPEDWDFFATIASVHVALNRLPAEVSSARVKHLYPIVIEQVRKLDQQGEAALVDCQNFVMRALNKDKPDQTIFALGLWVLWNLLRRQPTSEESKAVPGIGRVLAEPYLSWWQTK